MTTERKGQRALVIGCGIAGPLVAMALQRIGMVAEVHEARASSADDVGSFLNVASNGLDAMRSLGLGREIWAEAFPTPHMVMWSGDGKRLGEVANGLTLEDGTVSVTMQRGLLHRALREEAARRGIAMIQGHKLRDVVTHASGVVAHFEDGSEAHGDLLVGADGVHSRVRAIVDAANPLAHYTGQLSIGGIVRGSAFPVTIGTYHMVFGRRAFFGYSVRASGDAYWFANVAEPNEPLRGSREAISIEAWKTRLCALFEGDAGLAVQMICATESEFSAYAIYDMPPVKTWHRDGRIVLVGDAAHATSPSSGQGASMATEDALVLAKCLRDQDDSHAAFVAYEQARRARVERVVRYSRQVTQSKVQGSVGRFFRDLMMPTALKMFGGSEAHAWLYRHHIAWD